MMRRYEGSPRQKFIELLEPRHLLAVGVFSTNLDIGSPALPGSASYLNGTYTIMASGADIGGNGDQFHYAFNPVGDDDGSIIARVASLVNTNSSAKAGVMLRSGTSANAAFAGIFVTPTLGLSYVTRAADGGTGAQTISFGFAAPRFVRLSRAGSLVTAFHSANGITWTQVGATQTIGLGSGALAGLAATSGTNAALTSATFTNVSLLLPEGWSENDVGSPTLPGFATYDSSDNVFAVSGAGTGIGGSADQFSFASRSMTGDGSIIALVESLSGDPSTEATVMIRDDLSAGAKFASVGVDASSNLVFRWRSQGGASASSTSLTNINWPVWVKLSQQDGSFSAFYSLSGSNWTQIGAAQSIAMTSATTLYGLGVSAHTNSALATGTFSSVSIVQENFADSDIVAPALGGSATYDAPSNTYTLLGGGTGIGGTSDQFNFAR